MSYEPLAERLRPRSLDDYIGQRHLVGDGAVLRRMIESGNISSFILWGPPGVGKTTLARIIAEQTKVPFYTLSAVTSGVKDVREVLDRCQADARSVFSKGRPILFIDEIHRFNKSQQDSLLGAVERGTVTLIGATTENPSFEVIRPLLSRAQVYVLNPLDRDDLLQLLDHAIKTDKMFQDREIHIDQTEALLRFSAGDARKLLNILDLIMQSLQDGEPFVINDDIVTSRLQQNPLAFDKGGEMHYDIISAFIKSIRGSDPDAAVYWLARLIAGGEDPKFIARRLCILAAEDIGLANPNALLLANATFDIINKIGWPEGRIPLSECAIYLATSAKSNSAYLAIDDALALVNNTGNAPVPLHLRNAPTGLMKQLGYGKDYMYAHDYPGHFVRQQYMPEELHHPQIWHPQDNPAENQMTARQQARWGTRPDDGNDPEKDQTITLKDNTQHNMSQRGKLGKEGEQAACDFLISKGYTVRETNWRMGHLEIDIIAQEPQANTLHIVEVKTRTTDLHFDPMQAITKAKIRNLVNAANSYIAYYNLPMAIQYDVMILIGTPPNLHIQFIPNAFQPPLRTLR